MRGYRTSVRPRRRVLLIVAACLAGVAAHGTPVSAQGSTGVSSTDARAAFEGPLDEIRRDLAELRFEEALNAIEGFLARPDLPESVRVEALILRSQAHVAYGDLDAAESDYREILTLRPGYAPEASLTPPKAMARYERVRKQLVGALRPELRPQDARVLVDGRPVTPDAEGRVPLLAGEHLVRVEREGYDAVERKVDIAAGKVAPLQVALTPNARSVIVRTEPEDVEVWVDGRSVGRTRRNADDPQAPAQLEIPRLPLGEHVFEFRKPCFRTAVYRDVLSVDLDNPVPKLYRPIRLEPSSATLALEGVPRTAELFLDGKPLQPGPEGVVTCPGEHVLSARAGGRVIWQERVQAEEQRRVVLEVRPRPNAVLVGTESWPASLGTMRSEVNLLAVFPEAPPGRGSAGANAPSLPDLPPATDVVVTVARPTGLAPGPQVSIYAPALERWERIEESVPDFSSPSWLRPEAGWQLIADEAGLRVVQVLEGHAAAAASLVPGERIVSVDGGPVASPSELERRLASASGAGLALEVESPGGARRRVHLRLRPSPWIRTPDQRRGFEAVRLAAWASVARAVPTQVLASASASLNLASILLDAGRLTESLEVLRHTRLGSRSGVGPGTLAYLEGLVLEALGREREASEAFRRAAGSSATAYHDEGPEVAPAAQDHLADLGVTIPAGP